MKNILLKLSEKQFFKLLDIKQKLQSEKQEMLTWEDAMFLMAIKSQKKA